MTTALQLTDTSLITVRPEQLASDLDGETILLHMTSGLYYGLNPIGAKIWELIQSPKTLENLRNTLLADYDVTSEVCSADLTKLLTELHEANLIDIT
jgi:Coenzyme PQQ synthesis protein D (PqqD)